MRNVKRFVSHLLLVSLLLLASSYTTDGEESVLVSKPETVVRFEKLCTTIFGHQKGLTREDCAAFPDPQSCAKVLTKNIKVKINILVDESAVNAKHHTEIVCAFERRSVESEAVSFCSRHAQEQAQCVELVSRALYREFDHLNQSASCDISLSESTVSTYYDYDIEWMSASQSESGGEMHIVDNALPPLLFCLLSAEIHDAYELNSNTYLSDLQRRAKLSYSNFVSIEDIGGSVRDSGSFGGTNSSSGSSSINDSRSSTSSDGVGKEADNVKIASAPRNAIELAILHLLRLNFPNGYEHIVGAEWWIQIRKGRDTVPFHYDKDEAYSLENDDGAMLHPVLSTVTYLTESTNHGSASTRSDLQNPTVVVSPHEKVDDDDERVESVVVYPKKNRHMTFRGNLYHGVAEFIFSDRDNQTNERGAIFDEERITFLVNFWDRVPRSQLCAKMSDDTVRELLAKRGPVHRKSLSQLISAATLNDVSTMMSSTTRQLSRTTVSSDTQNDGASYMVAQFTYDPSFFSAMTFRSVVPVSHVFDPERAYVIDWRRRKERKTRFCAPRSFGQLLECVTATQSYARERYNFVGAFLVLVVSAPNVLSSQGALVREIMDVKATYEHRVAIVYVDRNVYVRASKDGFRTFEAQYTSDVVGDSVCASLLSFSRDRQKRRIFCREPTGYGDDDSNFCTCARVDANDSFRRLRSRAGAWFEWTQAPPRIGL